MTEEKNTIFIVCNFCGKRLSDATQPIAKGNGNAFICGDCITKFSKAMIKKNILNIIDIEKDNSNLKNEIKEAINKTKKATEDLKKAIKVDGESIKEEFTI